LNFNKIGPFYRQRTEAMVLLRELFYWLCDAWRKEGEETWGGGPTNQYLCL